VAEQYRKMGFINVKALKGGIEGWKAKGFPMKSPG
jgi:rhodanese-related sulfurtransferase